MYYHSIITFHSQHDFFFFVQKQKKVGHHRIIKVGRQERILRTNSGFGKEQMWVMRNLMKEKMKKRGIQHRELYEKKVELDSLGIQLRRLPMFPKTVNNSIDTF